MDASPVPDGVPMTVSLDDMRDYFGQRTPKYDSSSSWVGDDRLGQLMTDMLGLGEGERVLDVASGTGMLGKTLAPSGAHVVGLDYTPAMMEGTRPHYAELVLGDAHAMPFDDATFDAVVCRQGIQFMDAPRAAAEMARVVRPGGRVVLMHLACYGEDDREETFEIQRLRNPVRLNYFVADDQPRLLRDAGLDVDRIEHYHTHESARNWLGKGSIPAERQQAAFAIYRDASPAFRASHALEEREGDYIDRMLFVLARGVRR